MKTFLFAHHDMLSSTIFTYTYHILNLNPKSLAKEHDEVFGERVDTVELIKESPNALNDLPFIKQ